MYFVIKRAIGIVHPVAGWHDVKLRALNILGKRGEDASQHDAPEDSDLAHCSLRLGCSYVLMQHFLARRDSLLIEYEGRYGC
jgi:hypothetical protein